jgi:hypothetical protein
MQHCVDFLPPDPEANSDWTSVDTMDAEEFRTTLAITKRQRAEMARSSGVTGSLRLRQPEPVTSIATGRVFVFVTRAGVQGVAESSIAPRGLKIRYKILQPVLPPGKDRNETVGRTTR